MVLQGIAEVDNNNTIDPFNSNNLDIPLWLVYGPNESPFFLCVKIHMRGSSPYISGHSIYKRYASFKTISEGLSEWLEKEELCYFFSNLIDALAYYKSINTLSRLRNPE